MPSAPAAGPECLSADPAALQAQLAALWVSAPDPAPRPAGTDAPAVDAVAPTGTAAPPPKGPPPPAGAKLFFVDDAGRPCAAGAAYRWTWEGASAWFSAVEFHVPIGSLPKAEG